MNSLITNYLEDAIDELSHKARGYYHDYQYYVGANGIREILINTLKSRSEFKRTLKEYKKQCEYIRNQKYAEQIKEWREHPDKFIEDIYGTQLYPYQKVFLKEMFKTYLRK